MPKRILILSGPTHEYIDPVRFIGNASSGLMGKALAEEAVRQEYDVQFISGPVAPDNLPSLGSHGTIHDVVDAKEMLQQATALFSASDVVIFAAAVADYTPAEKKSEKMPKSTDDLVLTLKATQDIAKTLCQTKRPDQTTIGFALQTEAGEKNARRKLERKNLDGIVLNTPTTLGATTGTFSFLSSKDSDFVHWGCINKADCASRIFQALEFLSREK